MTTLAIGSGATVNVADGGTVKVASNGGFWIATFTQVAGASGTETFGPGPARKTFGPFSEGGSVTISNASANQLDYDRGPQGIDPALQALVSVDGNLAYAAVASTTGTPGEVRKLSDGPDKGACLVWAIPSGASAYAWCWQIYPLASYL